MARTCSVGAGRWYYCRRRRSLLPTAVASMESSATVGAVLKGMISYDTWSADPIGTYGGFVPDMVTTAVSMGSGGAAKLSVKALSMVSPGAAVKAARVLRVLRQVAKEKPFCMTLPCRWRAAHATGY